MLLALIAQQLAETVEESATLLDAQALAMLLGFVIPLLVGAVSKISASSGLKAVINALLSAMAGVLATVTQVDQTNWRDLVIAVGTTWIISVATYYGIWKPTGVAGTVTEATANFGIGPKPVMQTDDVGAEEQGVGV